MPSTTKYENNAVFSSEQLRARKSWRGMIDRCNPKKAEMHPSHAGRGITVCDRWKNFDNFFADMGDPHRLTLERIDNNGNYEPSNCKWATKREQSRNTRRNRMITHEGETLCAIEWCEKYDFKYGRFIVAMNRGRTIAELLTEQGK